MSIQAVSWALDVKIDTPLERVVLIALANHAGPEGTCYPSYNTIARMAVCSRRTAMRYVQSLCEKGYLSIEERKRNNGSKTSNNYCLNLLFGGICSKDPSDTESPPSDTPDTTLVTHLTPPEPSTNHQFNKSAFEQNIKQAPTTKDSPFQKTNKSIMPRIFEAVATKYLIARQEQWPRIVQGSKLNTVCITLANLDISEDPDDPIHDQVISAINHAVQTGEYTEFHRKPITSAIEAAYLVVSSKPEPDKPKPQQTCHHCPDPAALPNGLCIACNSRATS